MLGLDEEIMIELITDEHELRRKGHTLPVIELRNDYIDVWISIEDLSYSTLTHELTRITNLTRTAAEGEI